MTPPDNTELLTQVAELRADVRHAQKDITEIKTDVRELNQRMEAEFDRVDKKIEVGFDHINKKIEAGFDRIDKKFEGVNEKFDQIKDAMHTVQMWAIGLYIALAGTLLYVIARSAKWI